MVVEKIVHRDISPLLQRLRAFLLGRELNPTLRFQEEVAARTQPPPNIPDGATHKLNENYYFSRDVRREVKPPEVVASDKPSLAAGGEKAAARTKLPTPGKVYLWD